MNQELKKTEIVQVLSSEEEIELDSYEKEVETLSTNALENARRAGEILGIINQKRLWAKTRKNKDDVVYSTFAEYAKARFGRGKVMSYNYVAIANIMKSMEDEGLDAMMLGSIQNTLQVHHELRRLTRVNGQLNPLFRDILSKGITLIENICPIDEHGELIVTPESVKAAFHTIEQIAVSGAYEIDGEQHPITLGQIAVDDQASSMLYEHIQQRRLLVIDDARQTRNKVFEKKPGFQPTNIEEKYEEVYLVCPRHGTTYGDALLRGGIKMNCGCRAILQIRKDGPAFVWFAAEENNV